MILKSPGANKTSINSSITKLTVTNNAINVTNAPSKNAMIVNASVPVLTIGATALAKRIAAKLFLLDIFSYTKAEK